MSYRLALAGVLIAGSAIGFAMPLISGESTAAPAAPSAAETAPTLALAATISGDGLTLQREADGHFYADVAVEGQSTRMLVDTGASVIALTGEDAEAIGMSWDEAEIAVVAQGANGPVYGVHAILPEVELGGYSVTDVPALIVPEGLHVSLLGQSFLSKVGRVEIAGDAMVLGDEA